VKPLALFGGIVAVGLAAIFVGLRLTDHSASANPLPKPLTHAQFVRAGNAICDRYYRTDPTLFKKPKTLKALTSDLRISIPILDSEAAGLRALVPPPPDAATYQRLLGRLAELEGDAYALLHSFETGQVRRGVLIARHASLLDTRLNSLSRKLGLTVCGLSDRQVRARYGTAGGAPAPAVERTGGAARSSAGKAGRAAAPRFESTYRTTVRVLVDTTNPPLPVGYTVVRMWRFIQPCSGCAITLFRPSNLSNSTVVLRYTLHRVTGTRYTGKLATPGVCYSAGSPPLKVLPPGSIVGYSTLTIQPTRTSAGRVVAYVGTLTIRSAPSGWGRRDGCIASGYTQESVRSQG
jgi:hypothetical protein